MVKPMQAIQAPSSMDRFLREPEQQQPVNSNMVNHSMNNVMGFPHRQSELPPVLEFSGALEDPGAWLNRMGDDVSTTSPMMSSSAQSFLTSAAYQPFPLLDLSPPYGSASDPTASDTTMTRSNSTANQSVTGPFQMLRLGSMSSISSVGDTMGPPEAPRKKRPAPNDDELLGSSTSPPVPVGRAYSHNMGRSVSMNSRISQGLVQQMPRQPSTMDRRASMQDGARPMTNMSETQMPARSLGEALSGPVAGEGELMMRTISASSNKSTSSQSQRERAKDSLQRQIHAAGAQLLAPRPKPDPANPDSETQANSRAEDGGRVACPKSTYQRPKRPRIMCPECNEKPDGFRGEHELRRHKEAQHTRTVKKWICVDPTTKGSKPEHPPRYALDACKHCSKKKPYGQDYNAAAHLRRAHWQEKVPRAGRSKNGNANEEPVEKRGGKGGGDWPPMNYLREWMEEIYVNKDDANDAETVSDDEGLPDLTNDGGFGAFMNPAAGQFDDTAAYGVGSHSNLQVQDNEVYTDTFSDFPNYTTNTVPFDPSMMSSTGSASFNFTSPMTGSHGFPRDIPIDLGLLQSPHVSSSTPTLTPFNSFAETTQFTQGSSQPTTMTMSQQSQQDIVGDLSFALSFAGGFGDEQQQDIFGDEHQNRFGDAC